MRIRGFRGLSALRRTSKTGVDRGRRSRVAGQMRGHVVGFKDAVEALSERLVALMRERGNKVLRSIIGDVFSFHSPFTPSTMLSPSLQNLVNAYVRIKGMQELAGDDPRVKEYIEKHKLDKIADEYRHVFDQTSNKSVLLHVFLGEDIVDVLLDPEDYVSLANKIAGYLQESGMINADTCKEYVKSNYNRVTEAVKKGWVTPISSSQLGLLYLARNVCGMKTSITHIIPLLTPSEASVEYDAEADLFNVTIRYENGYNIKIPIPRAVLPLLLDAPAEPVSVVVVDDDPLSWEHTYCITVVPETMLAVWREILEKIRKAYEKTVSQHEWLERELASYIRNMYSSKENIVMKALQKMAEHPTSRVRFGEITFMTSDGKKAYPRIDVQRMYYDRNEKEIVVPVSVFIGKDYDKEEKVVLSPKINGVSQALFGSNSFDGIIHNIISTMKKARVSITPYAVWVSPIRKVSFADPLSYYIMALQRLYGDDEPARRALQALFNIDVKPGEACDVELKDRLRRKPIILSMHWKKSA